MTGIHQLLLSTFSVSAGVGPSQVEYLVIAGGGSGGQWAAGGGGAGGYRTDTSFSVTPGANITVTVGAGGDARTSPYSGPSPNGRESGDQGNDSVFSTIPSEGGGSGGGLGLPG